MNDRTGEPAICDHLLLGVTGSLTALTMPHYVFLMRQTLAALTPKHKGAFLNYDGRRFDGW